MARQLRITSRQRKILQLIGDGLTNNEIAKQMGISVKTLRNYNMILFQKFKAKSRIELIRRAWILGYIQYPNDKQENNP